VRNKNPQSAIALIIATSISTTLIAQIDPAKTFEVASVRQHQGTVFRSGPLIVDDPLLRLEGYTIYGLIMDAWHLRDFQLKIPPAIPKDDIYNKMYDIVARAPEPGIPRIDDVRAMLQNLLAARFNLRVHHATEEMQVYVLQVGKNGPRLKENSALGRCSVQTGLAPDGRNDDEVFTNCTIEPLADRLRDKIDNRPILDETGLTGRYDMHLIAAPELRTRSGVNPADVDPRTAVREMGLTLTPKTAAVDILVVDQLQPLAEN
jgi:uncharacterized protein (TIGR03435 family)